MAGADAYRFKFVESDSPDAEGGLLGAGFIVVTQDETEVQTIAHDFGMSISEIDPEQWLTVVDANGDGLPDFLVPNRRSDGDASVVGSLYQFDEAAGKFVLVETLSNIGLIDVINPGCLTITQEAADARLVRHEHCYSPQAGRWIRQLSLPGLMEEGERSALDWPEERQACAGPTPSLSECRRLRLTTDRTLHTALVEQKQAQRPALARERGRAYAQRYAVNLDASHRSWLQYRDNRCLAYVREQGFQAPLFQSANEACRFRLAQWQMQQYRVQ
ncbi:lysozyme inhibitor LprI family protein [Hydrogenophaga sp.]|uniref:lysozyme inhibitor LprI family protein n=1 Tax=Hydrogenophaga sp. TaxID=1904254 RepID=UPI0027187033|nr:lysozyme inhibitor LprI family protein [Hydrogenophaga sp.]MDO8906038.1 lysozyme inhibitor LprI family protein [Hydrogenophaga sp.]